MTGWMRNGSPTCSLNWRLQISRFLPYGRQAIDDDDIRAVVDVLGGDWLTTGPAVVRFEAAFAATVGARHAVSCANGTAALHLAVLALGLGPGEAAIVPAITFLATANVVRLAGAEVVFADVDPLTGLMTPETLDVAYRTLPVDKRTAVRAVLPVHLNGQCCDMAAIEDWCGRAGVAVVEDACHAVGGSYADGGAVGSRPGLTAFSFHPVKTIACGEGGMVTTPDPALAERLKRLRSHGMVRDADALTETAQATAADGEVNPWYYEMPEPGLNYRLSDIHAALGASQLAKLEAFVSRRAALVARYDAALAGLAPKLRTVPHRPGCPAWHLYVAHLDFDRIGLDRAAVMRALFEQGIGSQVHYLPLYRQPYYSQRYGEMLLPGAERYYNGALSLPLFPAMADEDVDRVAAALAEILCRSRS